MTLRSSIARMAFVAIAATPSGTAAERLAKDACEQLQQESGALVAAGVPDRMAHGAAWAKLNLSARQLKELETFIAIDEQLSFRCGMANVRYQLPRLEEQPAAEPASARSGSTKSAPGTSAPTVRPPKQGPEAKAKPRPAAGQAHVSDGSAVAPAAASPPARPRAKSKPRAPDAYRPPTPGDPADPPASKAGTTAKE